MSLLDPTYTRQSLALRTRRERKRHRHREQEETFVVLSGTLSMYLGDPPERYDIPRAT
jgi:quercetin dioxygenase-like cupin family protein